MIKMKDFLKDIKNSAIGRSMIPLGYGHGLPIICEIDGEIIIRVPFFREDFRGNDKTLVFPIQYIISAVWKNGKIIEARDLSYAPGFRNIEMSRPVGTFRHEAVAHMNKGEYFREKDALYTCYDKVLISKMTGEPLLKQDEKRFISKLNVILEPSLKPFYFALDKEFSEAYINKEGEK